MAITTQKNDCLTCKHSGSVLCSLKMDEKQLFTDTKKDLFLKKGEIVFKENHFPNGIFAIYEGKVKISKVGEEGKEQIVRFAKSGDLIGYRSLLSEGSYHGTATALCDIRVCMIPKKQFLEVLKNNYWLYKDLIKRLAVDLRVAEERILSMSQKTVRERIAETLIVLHHKFGNDEDSSIGVKLTRKEIGNIAGSTIETTIRTLSEFKKANLISFDGKMIMVLDISALISIANIH